MKLETPDIPNLCGRDSWKAGIAGVAMDVCAYVGVCVCTNAYASS